MTDPATARPVPPDQPARDAAIRERARNVLIDAGAGTGKTTILVDRLVEMIAPRDGGDGVPIERLAAITFTRKAAGELRLRIRERLLQALAEPGLAPARRDGLRAALAGLDTAHVGTIHSFADRLLRLRPVEAALSPSYEIAEDDEPLVRETFEVLMHAVENGTLPGELAGTRAAGRADEATVTVLSALAVGLLAESREGKWNDQHGLDALVAAFVRHRDVPPPDAPGATFDPVAFRAATDEFVRLAREVRGGSEGARWIAGAAPRLERLRVLADPAVVLGRLRHVLERAPRKVTLRDTFAGDRDTWKVWKRYENELRDAMLAPGERWMATRLARLFPVVEALYEKVKARRQALDQIDLLVKLRTLLLDRKDVRRDFQRLFDHVFVDEFQDTDPLQAEILLFLCEHPAVADQWDKVQLRPGSLTLVGDPKQSIYRFRRADVAMYDRVREVIARGPHLPVTLSANFRSTPPLIAWLNDRFDRVLGHSRDGRPFDAATGQVFQQPLAAGRQGDGDPGRRSESPGRRSESPGRRSESPGVHVLPFDFADGGDHKVDEYRKLEGRVLARYVRWLVTASDVEIVDPLDGRRRAVGYGDVAVLAVSTWRLSWLFPHLDREGVPYASRGGTLFLADPLHRQFLLGLRAIADTEDGVAEAALLRPPFFAVDLADLARERIATLAGREPDDVEGRRAAEARQLARELRRRRFERSPGETARDLLERTAMARAVALGPNGAQRLARLRELCLRLSEVAAAEGLDYDGVTARLRQWVTHPVPLDPPHPVGDEAVHVLTVHQAKGLEFPVVVLWDGKGLWDARLDAGPWRMERDGRGFSLNLHGLRWEEPAGHGLAKTEKAFLDAERRRVIYVAATRARDLLVLPRAGQVPAGKKFVCGDLLAEAPPALVRELATYRDGVGCDWADAVSPSVATAIGADRGEVSAATRPETGAPAAPEADTLDRRDEGAALVERDVDRIWHAAAMTAARPRWAPVSVTDLAHARSAPAARARGDSSAAHDGASDGGDDKPREGRFGTRFGSVVHHALGALVLDAARNAREAVAEAARHFSLGEHVADAVADVERALATLRAEGLIGSGGATVRVEYPVAGAWDGTRLVSGSIDLVAVTAARLDVIDVKTDAAPRGPAASAYPAYARQVQAYARLLDAAGLSAGREVRCGLLFTADGAIHWV